MVGKGREPKEQSIIDTATDLFRTSFPNPDREGCPSAVAIRAAARSGLKSKDVNTLEHLTCCSPCFVDFERALVGSKKPKRQKSNG